MFQLLIQVAMNHSNLTYVKIHLYKYNFRAVNSNAFPNQPVFYPKKIDFYTSCENDLNMSFIKLCQIYIYIYNGKLTVRDEITAVLTLPAKYGDIMSHYYHLY